MKTYTAPLPRNRQISIMPAHKLKAVFGASIQPALALLGAITLAVAIVLLSVWVAGLQMNDILGAGAWGTGFVFLGLAVDNREPAALLQLITGVALLVLAWLQVFVSPDFIIATGFVIAAWSAVSLFRQFR